MGGPVAGAAEAVPRRMPNFFYIGTSKAGSTWIYSVLDHHPEVFMAPGKGLYFFDTHYDRGLDWYGRQFEGADDEPVLGEVSHSYLFSPEACRRIEASCPGGRVMVCLREPADRAFSAYLDRIKNQKFDGPFEQALEAIPALVDRGRYATHLAPWLESFGRDRIHVAVFDELKRDPARFSREMFEFLGVEAMELPPSLTKRRMPAGVPRSKALARMAKHASQVTKSLGLRKLRGQVKQSTAVRNLLYRQYADDKPRMRPETEAELRRRFAGEIHRLDEMLGSDFRARWGY